MATTQHPMSAPRISDPTLRLVIASGVTLALVLVLILGPSANKSQAANMFGNLRAPGEPALIAGHRGDRSVAPENTLPALQAALNGPLVYVETDIRMSADGIPVLIHDDTVDRTTNGSGEVANLTLADLQALDAGSWYSPAFSETRIPTLESFLVLLRDSSKKAMLELKGPWSEASTVIIGELVESFGLRQRVVLASFDTTTLAALQLAVPELPRLVILRELPADPVGYALGFGAIGLVTSPPSVEADPSVVDRIHHAGLGILLYTLNKKKNWKSALSLGVDGIITDKPSKLDSWLAATAPGT